MLSAEEIAGYVELVELMFVHKYTREAVSDGTVDTWKMAPPEYGTAVSDIPCNYLSDGVLSTREGHVESVDTPSLVVASDDTTKVGDKITNVVDQVGNVLHAGPLYVEVRAPAAGFGIVTNYVLSLRGTAPSKW